MKKLLTILLVLSLVGCSNGFTKVNINNSESSKTHAIWFSFLEYEQMLTGRSEAEFTTAVQTMMSNLESLGINKIYAHASSYTDAFYKSSYYPWSKYCSGILDEAPGFDPLAIIINEATLRNIKVDAWINPLRSFTEEELAGLDDKYLVKQWYNDPNAKESHLMYANGRYYLNPGNKDVLTLIESIVKELCNNYSLTGIHIDDYFYPTEMSDELDQVTYQAYLAENPNTSIADYRIHCTDVLVETIHSITKTHKNYVFSISPNANIQTNLTTYYADVEKWMKSKDYCDQMIPQIYFGFENETMPFKKVVDQWESLSNGKVDLLFGLAGYKVGKEDKYAGSGSQEWIENTDVLARQLDYVSNQRYYDGIAIFRYYLIFYPENATYDQMQMELSKLKVEMNK